MLPPPPPAIVWQIPSAKPSPPSQTIVCDTTGVIRCSSAETVGAKTSADDIRVIAKYIALLSERNQRFYIMWREKLPSAAYELVRRIHPFPYLPYSDMYSITDMQLIIYKDEDRIVVRYPKHPEDKNSAEWTDDDYVVYETPLAAFMKVVEKEIGKLKKYEKT